MRFAILGSGSGGNSAVVECGGKRLLVDAGLSSKQLVLRLRALGVEPASLDGILLTHEHGDHVRGLKVFLRQHPLPVYATPATARVVRESGIEGGAWKLFEAGQTFEIGGALVESFAIQHDAVDPVGFVLADPSARKLGLLSDAGFVTRGMLRHLSELHALFVEANYDEELLEADLKRPWSIKQRISSRHGHLSNSQVEDLLREISHPALGRVVFGHLSSDCNRADLVLSRFRGCFESLRQPEVELHCACQHEPCGWFAV